MAHDDRGLGVRPRTRWLLAATVLVGLVGGLGAFTFGFAKGSSYLRDDPVACANCHVMQEYYDAWQKGSHRAVATCNSCHTPHNLIGKYATKANNGFWHSFYFTSGRYPNPISITARDHRITEAACRNCHGEITSAIDPAVHRESADRSGRADRDADDESTACTRCHATVGHWVRE